LRNRLDPKTMAQFTGSTEFYRHPLSPVGSETPIVYSEGAQYVAAQAGAYWLLDEIVTNQLIPKIAKEEFQVWKLKTDTANHTGVLTCEDGNNNEVFKKNLEYTDFPEPEISLWFTGNTIFLPSEY